MQPPLMPLEEGPAAPVTTTVTSTLPTTPTHHHHQQNVDIDVDNNQNESAATALLSPTVRLRIKAPSTPTQPHTQPPPPAAHGHDETDENVPPLPPRPNFLNEMMEPVVVAFAKMVERENLEPYKHVVEWQREPFEQRKFRHLQDAEPCDEHVLLPREVDAALDTDLEGIVDVHGGEEDKQDAGASSSSPAEDESPSGPYKAQVLQALRDNRPLKLSKNGEDDGDVQIIDCWGLDCYTRKNVDELLVRCLPPKLGLQIGNEALNEFVHRRLLPMMNSLRRRGWDILLALRCLAGRERERGDNDLANALEFAAAVGDEAEVRLFPKHNPKCRDQLVARLHELAVAGDVRAKDSLELIRKQTAAVKEEQLSLKQLKVPTLNQQGEDAAQLATTSNDPEGKKPVPTDAIVAKKSESQTDAVVLPWLQATVDLQLQANAAAKQQSGDAAPPPELSGGDKPASSKQAAGKKKGKKGKAAARKNAASAAATSMAPSMMEVEQKQDDVPPAPLAAANPSEDPAAAAVTTTAVPLKEEAGDPAAEIMAMEISCPADTNPSNATAQPEAAAAAAAAAPLEIATANAAPPADTTATPSKEEEKLTSEMAMDTAGVMAASDDGPALAATATPTKVEDDDGKRARKLASDSAWWVVSPNKNGASKQGNEGEKEKDTTTNPQEAPAPGKDAALGSPSRRQRKAKTIFDPSPEKKPPAEKKKRSTTELRSLQSFAWDKRLASNPVGQALQMDGTATDSSVEANGGARASKRMRKLKEVFDPTASVYDGEYVVGSTLTQPQRLKHPKPKKMKMTDINAAASLPPPPPKPPKAAQRKALKEMQPIQPPTVADRAAELQAATSSGGMDALAQKDSKKTKLKISYVPASERHYFRAHPKGAGVICRRPGGISAGTYIESYMGILHTPWRWFEKQDAVKKADPNMDLPDFYNIALERPSRDRRGFEVLYVDAADAGNFTSRLSHSCGANVATPVMAIDGKLRIVMHTTRDVVEGEEMCWDYSCVTESEREYRAASCLCSSSKCRGSFLYYSNSTSFSEVLNEVHYFLARNAMVYLACADQSLNDAHRARLKRHGFQHAARSADEMVSPSFPPPRNLDDAKEVGAGSIPWMARWASYVLEFIEMERGNLPRKLTMKRMGPGGQLLSEAECKRWNELAKKQAEEQEQQEQQPALDTGAEAICLVCGSGDNAEKMLLCDGCTSGAYHIDCLTPKLDAIPEGDWFCPACMKKPGGPVKMGEPPAGMPVPMYTPENAELEAVGVQGKRLQDLSVTLNKLKYFVRRQASMAECRGDRSNAAYVPPLRVLTDKEVADHLWNGEDSIGTQLAVACRALQPGSQQHVYRARCENNKKGGASAGGVAPSSPAKRVAAPRETASESSAIRELLEKSAKSAKEARSFLLKFSRLVREMPKNGKSNLQTVADVAVLYGYTEHWFTPNGEFSTVVSQPVDRTGQRAYEGLKIEPVSVEEELKANGGNLGGIRNKGPPDDKKRYGASFLWGQSASWFKQTIYDPTASLSADRRGCLSLPDPDSCRAYSSGTGAQSRQYFLETNLMRHQSLGWSTSTFWSFRNKNKVYGSPMHDDAVRWVTLYGSDAKSQKASTGGSIALSEEDGAKMPLVLRELLKYSSSTVAAAATKRQQQQQQPLQPQEQI